MTRSLLHSKKWSPKATRMGMAKDGKTGRGIMKPDGLSPVFVDHSLCDDGKNGGNIGSGSQTQEKEKNV